MNLNNQFIDPIYNEQECLTYAREKKKKQLTCAGGLLFAGKKEPLTRATSRATPHFLRYIHSIFIKNSFMISGIQCFA